MHRREPSLEKILERKELSSIEVNEQDQQEEDNKSVSDNVEAMNISNKKDEKNNNRVKRMMAEISDLKQAIKKDVGKSRATIEKIYN